MLYISALKTISRFSLLSGKSPSVPVTVAMTAPVELFLISTLALGTAALPGSATVPSRVPVVVWLKGQAEKSTSAHSV